MSTSKPPEDWPRRNSLRSVDDPDEFGCCLTRRKRKCQIKQWFQKSENVQLILMILAVLLAIIVGTLITAFSPPIDPRTAKLVGFPGELLMNMLKMLIIPLIVSTLISSIANLDLKSCGKIGVLTLVYFFITTFLAVILGMALTVAIHPGKPSLKLDQSPVEKTQGTKLSTLDAFLDLIRNMLPPNIVQACLQQIQSQVVTKTIQKKPIPGIQSNVTTERVEVIETRFIDQTNVIGLVTFSLAVGLCLAKLGERGRSVLEFFVGVERVIMLLINAIMWYAPFGIFFLVVSKIITTKNFLKVAEGLGLYMGIIISGHFIHVFIILTLIYFAFTRKNPLKFFHATLSASCTAFGTGSSSATLPVTLRCMEERLKIDRRVTRFVLPLGATMNMDGTALFEAVATIFIAQVNQYELSIAQYLIIILTATLAAIGAAGVPQAGLFTLVLVLSSVGLPVSDVALILAVDWIIDRFRTPVNVLGDCFGAAIVAHLCRKQLNATKTDEAKELEEIFDEVLNTQSSWEGIKTALPE